MIVDILMVAFIVVAMVLFAGIAAMIWLAVYGYYKEFRER